MSRPEVEATLARDSPAEVRIAVLAAALHGEDRRWAEDICIRLSRHGDFNVRGNAMLGLAHLARIHRELDASKSLPVIQAGLLDEHEYVRGQADDAADDVEQYLGWHVGSRRPN